MKIMVAGTRGIPGVPGGVETHCEELFPRLAELGWDVTVARRSGYVSDGLGEWRGVRLVTLPSPKVKAFEAVVHTFRAVNAARRAGADVLHVHAVGPALLVPYAKALGMKVVFTHHGPDYEREKWGRVAGLALRLGERFGCMFSDDVIAISGVIRDLIRRKYGRTRRVHLIRNGVPRAERCDCPGYFGELGIEEGRYVLGMCRFVPEKNLHHLVQAFTRMRNAGGVRLVLAGDADFEDGYSRSLKREAAARGAVLTGFVRGRKLHALLSHCLCYCLPSSHEGLPIALLEAMSHGARVVASDIPANLEVGLDGDCYFPVGDVEALARKLDAIASAPPRHVDYDLSKYDWDRIAAQVSEVYLALREGGTPAGSP